MIGRILKIMKDILIELYKAMATSPNGCRIYNNRVVRKLQFS
jgi:hypothetical protein